MTPIIVAFDGSTHAQDALALGHTLGRLTGASLTLVAVHRAEARAAAPSSSAPGREQFLRREDERMLKGAAASITDIPVSILALAGPTTASALGELAEAERAELIVFGSAHDGPVGRVHPGSATRRLLQGCGCAVAVAPVGLHERPQPPIASIAVTNDDEAASAAATAGSLAGLAGARVISHSDEPADLIVVGSRASAPRGRLMISAGSEQLLRSATIPVIAVAHDRAIDFAAGRSQSLEASRAA